MHAYSSIHRLTPGCILLHTHNIQCWESRYHFVTSTNESWSIWHASKKSIRLTQPFPQRRISMLPCLSSFEVTFRWCRCRYIEQASHHAKPFSIKLISYFLSPDERMGWKIDYSVLRTVSLLRVFDPLWQSLDEMIPTLLRAETSTLLWGKGGDQVVELLTGLHSLFHLHLHLAQILWSHLVTNENAGNPSQHV